MQGISGFSRTRVNSTQTNQLHHEFLSTQKFGTTIYIIKKHWLLPLAEIKILVYCCCKKFGSCQAKKWLQTCAKATDSDHPWQWQSIFQAFALNSYFLWYPMILLGNNEGADQTAWMCRLIWTFSVHICLKTCFCVAWPVYLLYSS